MAASKVADRDALVCDDAVKFVALFYDVIDRKRDRIGHLYSDNEPTLVWNGNPILGQEDIIKFITALPLTSHTIQSYDAHRMPNIPELAQMPEAIVVSVSGTATVGNTMHAFTQNFILSNEDGRYKVETEASGQLNSPFILLPSFSV